jgi:hypothetical protein
MASTSSSTRSFGLTSLSVTLLPDAKIVSEPSMNPSEFWTDEMRLEGSRRRTHRDVEPTALATPRSVT